METVIASSASIILNILRFFLFFFTSLTTRKYVESNASVKLALWSKLSLKYQRETTNREKNILMLNLSRFDFFCTRNMWFARKAESTLLSLIISVYFGRFVCDWN